MKLIDELINGRYNPLGNEKQVDDREEDEDNIAMEVVEDMDGVEDEYSMEVPEQSKVVFVQDNLEEKLVDKIFARWSLEDLRYY